MFEIFDFEVTQGRYVKAAMDKIASFRPDGKTPAQAQALIDGALAKRTTFVTTTGARNLARGELAESRDLAHAACVQVFAIMKSRYRTDPGSLSAINRLPVDDKTSLQTITRMEAMSLLWAQLPNPPGSATPFKAWDTMDKTAFDLLLTALQGKSSALAAIEQDYEIAQGELHVAMDALADFCTAALIQGRSQFEEGTAQREVIDAIPTEPAQQAPSKAVITTATSPAAGQVHLEFNANHATSYDVLQKAPGATSFTIVASDIIEVFYDDNGLLAGTHEFKVVGRNSRGDGPESDPISVTVG